LRISDLFQSVDQKDPFVQLIRYLFRIDIFGRVPDGDRVFRSTKRYYDLGVGAPKEKRSGLRDLIDGLSDLWICEICRCFLWLSGADCISAVKLVDTGFDIPASAESHHSLKSAVKSLSLEGQNEWQPVWKLYAQIRQEAKAEEIAGAGGIDRKS